MAFRVVPFANRGLQDSSFTSGSRPPFRVLYRLVRSCPSRRRRVAVRCEAVPGALTHVPSFSGRGGESTATAAPCVHYFGFCLDQHDRSLRRSTLHPREVRLPVVCLASLSGVSPPETESIWSLIGEQFAGLRQEWRQLLPMCSLFFFMAFINTLINNLALSMVMTSEGGGAVVIPFLNVYAVLPASVLFTFCYAYAAHHMTRNQLFNGVIGAFALLLAGFAFLLYPHHGTLHLQSFSDHLTAILPGGLAGGIGMVRNWTFTLFYCVSELWGDVGLSLLFWGFANEITHVDSAPLLYPLFGIGANLAQMLGGIVLRLYASIEFAASFRALTLQMLGCMGIVIILHHLITVDVDRKKEQQSALTVVRHANGTPSLEKRREDQMLHNGAFRKLGNGHVMHVSWRRPPLAGKKEQKRSFKESLRFLSESPQIRSLAIMTVAQSLSVTLMEFLWKVHLRFAYPTPEAFTGFLGDVSAAAGAVTGCLMLVSPLLFRKLQWKAVANMTPNVLSWGGVIFFGACFVYHFSISARFSSVAPLMMMPIILGGAALFVLSRGAKFSLFKPAEEMVYLSLDKESRTKGKAAVDVVGAQVGKSGGSILQQVLLMMSGGQLLSITPIMIGVYFYMLGIWKESVNVIASRQQLEQLSASRGTSAALPSKKQDVLSLSLSNRGPNSKM